MSNLQPLKINEIRNNNLSINQQYKLIEEEKEKAKKLYSQLTSALIKNNISVEEHDYAIRKLAAGMHEKDFQIFIEKKLLDLSDKKKELHTKRSRQIKATAYVLGLVILVFAGLLIQGNPEVTGFSTYVDKVVLENVNYNFTNNTIKLNYTNSSTFKISGYIEGLGTVKIFVNDNLLVYEDSINDANSGIISTNKKHYLVGEEIIVSVENAELEIPIENNDTNTSNASNTNNSSINEITNETTNETNTYTLYLKSENTTEKKNTNNFTINKPGTYEIYALIESNGLITKESAFIEIVDSLKDIKKEFSEVCADTCTLNNINITSINAITTGDAKVVITKIITTNKALNNPPRLIKEFEDVTITKGMNITKNLKEYFIDDEGQEIIYDLSSEAARIENNQLIISGLPGSYEAIIYASDSMKITESNIFTITITETQEANNNTSNTSNNSEEIINEIEIILNNTNNTNNTNQTNIITTPTNTINTSNMTYEEVNNLGLCDNPNPNEIPVVCLEGNVKKYFPETNVYIENLDGKVVARITPIGNLLIKGQVIYESTSNPGPRDFKLGYVDNIGNFYPTIWVSKEGDLHLQGSITEEQIDLAIPNNVYSFRNRRGVNLGYVEKTRGSLFLRGNLITQRGDLE